MELPEPQIIQVGDMELDTERGRLSKGRRSSSLGPMKVKMFELFSQHPSRVISEDNLRLALYGEDYRGEAAVRAVLLLCRRTMRRLQSKSKIKNIRYYGWEFVPPA